MVRHHQNSEVLTKMVRSRCYGGELESAKRL